MPKTKAQKQSILTKVTENLKDQQSVLFVDYKGIGVKDLSLLRKQLKEVGAKLEVVKKTLLSKAFSKARSSQRISHTSSLYRNTHRTRSLTLYRKRTATYAAL